MTSAETEKTEDLWHYILCEKKIMLILWPSLEIQLVDPSGNKEKKERQNLKNIKLCCSVAKLCGPYVIWHVKKDKSLRNNPLNSCLRSEKLSQPAVITFIK